MEPSQRIVVKLPVHEVWRDDGTLIDGRVRDLTSGEIGSLLRHSRLEFVVADSGLPLKWIGVDECYRFWKTEVKPHLAEDRNRIDLEAFPDAYAYIASEWTAAEILAIVVLEKIH